MMNPVHLAAILVLAVSAVLVFYVYAGYPIVIWLLSKIRPYRHSPDPEHTPPVSMIICAYNEEKCIGQKIENALSMDYPPDRYEVLLASDGSSDRTAEIARSFHDPRLRFLDRPRTGKSALLNELVSLARGEVLVFSDANSMYHPRVVRALAAHFSDPHVGLVTGEMRWKDAGRDTAVGKGTRAYWRYESVVKRVESALGSVLVCVGSCFAMRKIHFREQYPDVANDFQMPMEVGAQGARLLYEPEAYSLEFNTGSGREEFGRTVRIVTRGMTGVRRMGDRIRGLRKFQLYSRKVLRWFVAEYMILALVSSLFLWPFWPGKALVLLQAGFYGFALSGYILSRLGVKRLPRILSIPMYFCLVNIAALCAQVRFLRGRTFTTWQPAMDSRRK